MYKGFIKLLLVLCLLVFAPCGLMQAQSPGLVFWNGLGSDAEVLNSFVGPNLVFYTSPNSWPEVVGDRAYVPGVVGNAVTLAGGPFAYQSRIHNLELTNLSSVIDPEKGTIELWYYQTENPVAHSHAFYRLFDGSYGLGSGMAFQAYTSPFGSGAWMELALEFGGTRCAATFDMSAMPNNTWVHLCGAWDRNGIAGTADTIRLYMDGAVMAATTANGWGTSVGYRADICGGQDQNFLDKYKMDELKIWNYAKCGCEPQQQWGDFSVLGYNSVHIKTGCTVESGDVAVMAKTAGPWLSSLAQLVVGDYVHGHDNVAFKADSIAIDYGSTIYDAFYNSLDNAGTIRNDQGALTMPMAVNLPSLPAPAPGTQDVQVLPYTQLVLQPGSYGKITVYNGANLIFAGGTYNLDMLYVPGDYCGIYFRAPSAVNIATRFITDVGMTMGPENGTVSINDIRIDVHYASPSPLSTEAVRFGPYAMARGIVHAPNGTIKVKNGCTVEGRLIGKDVYIWSYVLIRLPQ